MGQSQARLGGRQGRAGINAILDAGLVSSVASEALPPDLEAEPVLCLSTLRVLTQPGSSFHCPGRWHVGQGLRPALGLY